ncbi:MAG: hypothetical protein JWM11_1423 [Planctomycetaceae bacterium]|nr:hypothetical protein [Planctomycetaceae bacterium]
MKRLLAIAVLVLAGIGVILLAYQITTNTRTVAEWHSIGGTIGVDGHSFSLGAAIGKPHSYDAHRIALAAKRMNEFGGHDVLTIAHAPFTSAEIYEIVNGLQLAEFRGENIAFDDKCLDAISTSPHLTLVGLTNCPVTPAGLVRLKSHSALKLLYLNRIRLSAAEMDDLQQQLGSKVLIWEREKQQILKEGWNTVVDRMNLSDH